MAQVHAGDIGLREQDAVVYRVGIPLGYNAIVQDCDDTVDNLHVVIRSVIDDDVSHLEAVVVYTGVDKTITVCGDFGLHGPGLDGTEPEPGDLEEPINDQQDEDGCRYGLEKFSD